MIAIDTCVLIAYCDLTHIHHDQAERILADAGGQDQRRIMGVVAAAEFMVHPAKAGQTNQAQTILDRIGIELAPIQTDAAARLSNLRATTGLKMPDVIVLDLALQNQASLATFDIALAEAARTKGLTVIGV